jgi:hypothetical protein
MILSLGRSRVKIKTLKKSLGERRLIGGEGRLRFNSSLSLEKEILDYPLDFFIFQAYPPHYFLEDFFGECV